MIAQFEERRVAAATAWPVRAVKLGACLTRSTLNGAPVVLNGSWAQGCRPGLPAELALVAAGISVGPGACAGSAPPAESGRTNRKLRGWEGYAPAAEAGIRKKEGRVRMAAFGRAYFRSPIRWPAGWLTRVLASPANLRRGSGMPGGQGFPADERAAESASFRRRTRATWVAPGNAFWDHLATARLPAHSSPVPWTAVLCWAGCV